MSAPSCLSPSTLLPDFERSVGRRDGTTGSVGNALRGSQGARPPGQRR
jgi:hypothetical protein